MKNNKEKNAAKRRQKKALRDTRRRKGNRGKKRVAKALPGPQFDINSMFPEPEYQFWLAHGANYLASDYKEGNWTPLFPDLYTGRLYEPEELVQRTLAHFEKEGDAGGVQKRIIAWLLTERTLIWAFKAGMAHRVMDAFPSDDPVDTLRKPHVGVLWEGFSQVFDAAQRGEKHEETDDGGNGPAGDPGGDPGGGSPDAGDSAA
jgi:hypothetical protein